MPLNNADYTDFFRIYIHVATSIYSKVLILKCSMGVVGGASTVFTFSDKPIFVPSRWFMHVRSHIIGLLVSNINYI